MDIVLYQYFKEAIRAKFLFKASYTHEGTKGLVEEGGTGRRAVVEQMVKGMGGKLDFFYYAFGETDVYLVVDLPDSISAAAVSLSVNAIGAVTLATIPLMSPEEIGSACKKSVQYRAPGR